MERRVREQTIERYLVNKVKQMGGLAYKFTSPARRSVPDRLCIFPTGVIVFIEVKAPTGRLTKGQERELKRLEDLGCVTTVVYNKEQVDAVLKGVNSAIEKRLAFVPKTGNHADDSQPGVCPVSRHGSGKNGNNPVRSAKVN